MRLKVWIKSRLADRALAPIRDELKACLETHHNESQPSLTVPSLRVLDVGCGTGHFLIHCSPIIREGLGIDLDEHMIEYAKQTHQAKQLSHLTFECMDAQALTGQTFDVGVSTLCLHEMPTAVALTVLKIMLNTCESLYIADYAEAKNWVSKWAIEFDEMISGHYARFRAYRRLGGIPGYAEQIGARCIKVRDSQLDGIVIWKLDQGIAYADS